MKYLFVAPHKMIAKGNIPYGMGIVATYAKHNGFDVQVFQSNVYENKINYLERLEKRLSKRDIGCLCIGSMATVYIETIELISIAKKYNAITVLGGNLVDPYPELIAMHSGADYCIIGEGEETFLELCNYLDGKCTDLHEIAGLCYRSDEGGVIRTAQRQPINDLNVLPFLDLELVGQSKAIQHNRVLYIYASRSCPFQCTFCYHLKGFPYRQRSLDNIFSEIENALNLFGDYIDYIDIFDDLFNLNEERVLDFCERIKKTGKKFGIQVRLDLLTERSIIALADAGCCKVSVGIESADAKVLKSMKKKSNQQAIQEKMDLMLRHNLLLIGNLLIGDPADSIESLHRDIQFYNKYSSLMFLDFIMTETYPGTELYKLAQKRGLIKDEIEYLEKGDFLVNLTSLSDSKYEIVKKLCRNFNSGKLLKAQGIVPNDAPFTVDLQGKCEIGIYCPHCLMYQTHAGLNGIFSGSMFDRIHVICMNCGQLINNAIPIFSAIRDWDYYEAIFAPYKGQRILIKGIYAPEMKAAVMQSQSLRDCLVGIVDEQHGILSNQKYCGFSVLSLCTADQIGYDVLCEYDIQTCNFIFTSKLSNLQ